MTGDAIGPGLVGAGRLKRTWEARLVRFAPCPLV